MEGIYQEINRLRNKGEKAVLATIITKLGPAPREKGAKLLVREDGSSLGAISGGCVEAEVWQEAMEAIKTGKAKVIGFHLTEKDAVESGLICGGRIEVYLDPLWRRYGTQEDTIFQEIVQILSEGVKAILATSIQRSDSTPQGKLLIKADGTTLGSLGNDLLDRSVLEHARKCSGREEPILVSIREAEVYLEPISPTPALYIFGGGHISLPLVRIGKIIGFKVIVIDDRELYANKNRFPEADEVYALGFESFFDQFKLPPFAYVIIVTRGHQYDELVLERALKTEATYIGMIGSKRKVRYTYEQLKTRGVTEEELSRVHSPIGLDIKAETPEEIAVSILAEVIQKRRTNST
jgi:xanthine dehydrogenase accessory factor